MTTPVLYSQPLSQPVNNKFAWPPGHKGDDHGAPLGTAIHAISSGTVIAVGHVYTKSATVMGYDYGNWVAVRHADKMVSFYAHCDQLLVRKGQHVARLQHIANVGETGGANGYHLHLGLMRRWLILSTLTRPSTYIARRTPSKIASYQKYITRTYMELVLRKPSKARLNLWTNKFINGTVEAALPTYLKRTATYKRVHRAQ